MGYEQFHVSFGGAVNHAVYMTVQRLTDGIVDGLWFTPADGLFAARTGGDSPVPYLMTLTDTGGDSYVLTVPPATDLPVTTSGVFYKVHFYNQLGATPDDNDDLIVALEGVTWNGVTVAIPGGAWSGDITSETKADIRAGVYNITNYSSRDGTQTRDLGAIAQAGRTAEAAAQSIFSQRYATPLTSAVINDEAETAVTDLMVYHLHKSRPDSGVTAATFEEIRRNAMATLAMYGCGQFPAYSFPLATARYAESNAPRTDETTGVHRLNYPTGQYLTGTGW